MTPPALEAMCGCSIPVPKPVRLPFLARAAVEGGNADVPAVLMLVARMAAAIEADESFW